MLIAVLNQKGGFGTSTTAVFLARWLQLQWKTVHLADPDTQQTSSFWLQAADQFSIPSTGIPAAADVALEQRLQLVEGEDGSSERSIWSVSLPSFNERFFKHWIVLWCLPVDCVAWPCFACVQRPCPPRSSSSTARRELSRFWIARAHSRGRSC